MTIDIQSFATEQLKLLCAELAAETSANTDLLSGNSPTVLKRAGLAILNLSISSQRTGLGGKTVIELEEDSAVRGPDAALQHDLRTGDIVRVGEQPKGSEKKREKSALDTKGANGVVVKVSQKGLHVALDKEDENLEGLGGRLWVVKLANDVTYRRMNQTMEKMQNVEEKDQSTLTRILFGLDAPSPVPQDQEALERQIGSIEFFDPALNESQRAAVRFALCSREIALIHGPPGTGKTYTLIELILQLTVRRNLRVLVCGPSNLSVDNIVERLSPHKLPIVRLGHSARLLPSVLNHSLDVLIRTSEASAIVKDIRDELDAKQASIRKTKSGRERKGIYSEMKDLRKEYRERERGCVNELVRGSKVVLATLHGAGGYQLRNTTFDVVIIDEASQALEAQCWIPLLSAKKVILAGDHLQLPPTIKSTQPKNTSSKDPSILKNISLEITLFDRLLSLHGPSIKRLLTTQYRMHELIMRFPSSALYDDKLIAAESVKARLLTDLPYDVKDTDDTREPLIFYDTQGGDFPERAEDLSMEGNGEGSKRNKSSLVSDSKSNEMEALLAKHHVQSLLTAGVHPQDIAIITPYNAQVSLLSSLLLPSSSSTTTSPFLGLEIGSVDGFQGREKEVVLLSLVRSNPQGEVGFLKEARRLNVAMTRPKRQLCVIGDSETVGKGSEFLKRWMGFLEESADLRYPDAGGPWVGGD